MNLAIDAGGTNLRAEIWDKELLITYINAKSSEIGLCLWIEKILKEYKNIKTIGIAYAGQVENGFILASPNIDIDEEDIKKYIESHYEVSLKIENDLSCAVLAEAKVHNSSNICALSIGTGLGLGSMESGRLIRGSHNMAAEIGHIPYKDAPFSCGCGRSNCIELFASGSAIKKWVAHYAPEYESIFASKVTLENLKNSQDEKILPMFEEALVYSAAIVITLFNPEVLVLGGGIMLSNTYLKEIITRNIDKYALSEALKDVKICISTIDDAPLQGALLLKDYNG